MSNKHLYITFSAIGVIILSVFISLAAITFHTQKATWNSDIETINLAASDELYIPKMSQYESDRSTTAYNFPSEYVKWWGFLGFILLITLYVAGKVLMFYTQYVDESIFIIKQRGEDFRKGIEQLYDNIYAVNITKNLPADETRGQLLENTSAPPDSSYDDILKLIAKNQIKEEFQQTYIDTFCTENVLREFKRGNFRLKYELLTSTNGQDYYWVRISGFIYQCNEDDTVRMYSCRQNIDSQRRKELLMAEKAEQDCMTKFLHKEAVYHRIQNLLLHNPNSLFGFIILDIDNFKQVNDTYGHVFGDTVILKFSSTIRRCFREDDILGRIGGDEFVVFLGLKDKTDLIRKVSELSQNLNKTITSDGITCTISASIGASFYPDHGTTFKELYLSADKALYQAKREGKNRYTIL